MKTYSHIITLTSFLLFSCGAVGVGESNHDVNSTEDQNSSITSSDQNGSRLVIVTKTAGSPYAKTKDKVFARIIGLEGRKLNFCKLDETTHPSKKAMGRSGQVDTFSLPIDYPISKIRGVELEAQGPDGWLAKTISFQLFDSGKKSEVYEFELNQWLQTDHVGETEDGVGAVESKLFSFRPELK